MIEQQPGGAQSSAVVFGLIRTAIENGLDAYWYLAYIFRNAPVLFWQMTKRGGGLSDGEFRQLMQKQYDDGMDGVYPISRRCGQSEWTAPRAAAFRFERGVTVTLRMGCERFGLPQISSVSGIHFVPAKSPMSPLI